MDNNSNTTPNTDTTSQTINGKNDISEQVNITFKMPGGSSFNIAVDKNMTVAQLKDSCVKQTNTPPAQQRIIFKGRILKDTDTLVERNVCDGAVLHLVQVSSASASSSASSSATLNSATTASKNMHTEASNSNKINSESQTNSSPSLNSTGNVNDMLRMMLNQGNSSGGGLGLDENLLSNLSGGNSNSSPLIQAANRMMNIDPQNLTQIMQNPGIMQIMNDLTSNTEFMQSIMQSNPTFQQIMNQNPLMQQGFENPSNIFREMFSNTSQNTGTQGSNVSNASSATPALNSGVPDFSTMIRNMQQTFNSNPELQRQMLNIFGLGNSQGDLSASGVNPNIAYPQNQSTQTPEERYATQLNSLEEMGFIDRAAGLVALQECNGDLSAAISRLLDRGLGN